MPYASNKDLPPAVRGKLKGKRLRQWREVFNSQYERTKSESISAASAWAAVHSASKLGKAQKMSDFHVFMPICKIDKDKRTVSGYASTPAEDGDGEIVSLDAIRGALPGYMEYGNIREMHALKAVGVAQEANMDTKGLFLTAKIVDAGAWEKCVEGVYKGFSIGGRKLDKKGKTITELELTEISIVDRPSNPECNMAIAKSAKTLEDTQIGYLIKDKPKATPEAKAIRKMAKAMSALTKSGPPAAHDGFSLPAPTKKADEPVVAKAEDVKCEPHGEMNCAKCAAAKAAGSVVDPAAKDPPDNVGDDPALEPNKKAKKKKAKKAEKALLAQALGISPDSFLSLRKAQPSGSFLDLRKSMNTVGSMSYSFDSLRSAQRSLLMEAKREGGDMKDKALALRVGTIAKDLADVISLKASHEGGEALDLSDADDSYVSTIFSEGFNMDKMLKVGSGDPLTDAVAAMMKRAATPSRAARMAMASGDVKKARKAMKAARDTIEEAHKMCKAAYFAKAAKKADKKSDEDDEFDHAGMMGKLQKAFGDVEKALTMSKSADNQIKKALSRSGQRGQEAGDAEAGFYEVPPGVTDLSPAAMAGAAPGSKSGGSQPPAYPVDGSVYAGKADGNLDIRKFAKNGVISADVAELLFAKAQSDGALEAIRALPAAGSGGRRPYAFDTQKLLGGQGNGNQQEIHKAMFRDVNMEALNSGDEREQVQESAKVAGNFLMTPQFGKSLFDPSFNGKVGA